MFWTNTAIDALIVCFVIACGLLCLIILMQRSKQEGLGAAFGGGLTSEILGAGTSAFLVKATVYLATAFFIISILLARLYSYRANTMERPSPVQEQLLQPVTAPKSSSRLPVVPTSSPMVPVVPSASNANNLPAATSASNASALSTTPSASNTPAAPVKPASK